MMPSDPSLPPDVAVDRLLAETHLRVRQGRYAEAGERLQEAKRLAPDHPAVVEMEGDLAFAQGRFRQAEQLYRKAFAANPTNAKLEEKFGTALVKVNQPAYIAHDVPDDEGWWSNRVARPVWASTFWSMLIPGVGQLYNGDFLKGGLLLFFDIILWSYAFENLKALKGLGTVETVRAVGEIFQGSPFITLLLLAAWLYGVVDAALVARSMKRS